MLDEYDEIELYEQPDRHMEQCTICGVRLDEYQVMLFEEEPYCTHCFPHEEIDDIDELLED